MKKPVTVDLRETDGRRADGINVTGRDIVIGVVDWGVDIACPNLMRPDGRTRFLSIWDQRDGRDGEIPQPYGYGRVFTRDAIDAALTSGQPYENAGLPSRGRRSPAQRRPWYPRVRYRSRQRHFGGQCNGPGA